MTKRTLKVATGVAFAATVLVGWPALAHGADERDASVSGRQADEARAAALLATNGGRAHSVERDTENGATWEVEVTRTDGSTVDVRLDETYALVVIEGDHEAG